MVPIPFRSFGVEASVLLLPYYAVTDSGIIRFVNHGIM
jgi:hypothetical protein